MRLIDAEPIIAKVTQELDKAMKDHLYGAEAGLMYMLNIFNAIPTIDAVQVVRCKDCRYYDYPFPDPKENADANPERWCCLLGLGGAFGKDSYCSYGERRTDVD